MINLQSLPKKTLYTILGVAGGVVAVLATTLIVLFNLASLKLNIKDGDTFVLEYGVDTVAPVTALYFESFFDQEGMPVTVTQEGVLDITKLGTYEVTYTATYENNTTTATVTYTVQDTVAPEIQLLGDNTIYYSPGYTYVEPGFTASDNYDGDITDKVTLAQTEGIVTYTVTDSFGNTTSVTREVICKDIVPPVFTLEDKEKIYIAYESKFTDPGYTVVDDVDGDITASVEVIGSIDTHKFGEQSITYVATDSSGNKTEVTRYVVVRELTPPELTLTGGSKIYVLKGESYSEPGFSAVDNIDGNITDKVKVSGSVDPNTCGSYTVTYTATDSSDNVTTVTRKVYVYQPQTAEQIANATTKIVYLTFDDGPGRYTQQLLDILDKYNVDVTFFVTGQYRSYFDMIGEAHRRGHTIAIHTYTHEFSDIYSSVDAYYADLNRIKDVIVAQTGVEPKIVRFPGGTSNTISIQYCKGIMTALAKSLTENGYYYSDWHVDSKDAGGASTSSEVARNVINGINGRKTSIVLQHDIKKFSVNAVDEIICWGLANGYTFLPMTENTKMYHHNPNN